MTNPLDSGKLRAWPCILLAAVAMAVSAQNSAAAFAVTSLADNGPGTLRAALAAAADGDTVDATGVSGTILLTGGELLVGTNVAILGPGPGSLAVDGNAASRVFYIQSNLVVSVLGITITNGNSAGTRGGGIYSDHATLTVTNCVLSGNTDGNHFAEGGGGIYSDGRNSGGALLRVSNCIFNSNTAWGGGAIKSDGSSGGNATLQVDGCSFSSNSEGAIYSFGAAGTVLLTVVNSTFTGNHGTGSGGAILNNGSLGVAVGAVTNCTFNSNFAQQGGGGICNGDGALTLVGCTLSSNATMYYGGALDNYWSASGRMSTLTLLNSTFSGNTGDNFGGALANSGPSGGEGLVNITGCTFCNNSCPDNDGDLIYNDNGRISIGSTILNANPALPSFRGIFNGGQPIVSWGFNLYNSSAQWTPAPGDQFNTNPLLGPLQANGGPTMTHALLPGSPAINMGKDLSGLGFDQRGHARPFVLPNASRSNWPPGGDGSDIGAYEFTLPILAISLSGHTVTLSWPAEESGYFLQYNTSPISPSGWTTMLNGPYLDGNRFTQSDTIFPPAHKFYRLKQY